MMADDQTETIAFLTAAATHGVNSPPEVIETHISLVALAGNRAYKLKKALKLVWT
ncbi:hypothetical protein [Shinella sp.]|uniref:hypothetical protein n=1 Tax=Shinella sp. TaxID=1870904 RepID=UPI0029AC28C4|nr:hypothetical protein [Shinella sp.]MDX3972527.1 hypothetical protein [Shinella sp.]